MAGWSSLQSRGRSWLIGAVLLAVGVAVGYTLPQSTVSPKSEIGRVSPASGKVSGPGTVFDFTSNSAGTQKLRFVESTPWRLTKSAKWNWTGTPPCLTAKNGSSAKITLG